MSFRWMWEGGASEDFDTQQGAEDWMGAEWKPLLDSGVLEAILYDGAKRLYRMRLTPD